MMIIKIIIIIIIIIIIFTGGRSLKTGGECVDVLSRCL